MSMYFDTDDETLWNPSSGSGRLFLRQLQVFEAELGLPSGIGHGRHWGDPDTLKVDPVAYGDFTRALVDWHCRTGNSVIRALSEGFVAIALALARRAGIEVEVPAAVTVTGDGSDRCGPAVGGPPPVPPVAEALDARAREPARSITA
ncbi:DUF6086 family protein [Streptomyces sp. NPDC054842]